MNDFISCIAPLIQLTLLIMIMSAAFGFMIGGPAQAKKVLLWELGQIKRFAKWITKGVLNTLGSFFQWIAKQI